MAEKRTSQLPAVRCSEQLEVALMRLAAADRRELTAYVRAVLERHVWGHAATVDDDGDERQQKRALQCDALRCTKGCGGGGA